MPVTTSASADTRPGRGEGIGIDAVSFRLAALVECLSAFAKAQERVHREREWRDARATLTGQQAQASKAMQEELAAPATPLDAEKGARADARPPAAAG